MHAASHTPALFASTHAPLHDGVANAVPVLLVLLIMNLLS